VPSGEYIKTYCEHANRQIFRVWNSHCQHAACQTMPAVRSAFSAIAELLVKHLSQPAITPQTLRYWPTYLLEY